MKRIYFATVVFPTLIWFTTAPVPALSQTVQLPAIRQFWYSGGVAVPDRGSADLGGNRSSAITSSSRGVPGLGRLPGGTYRSAQSSSGGVSVHTTIIDLDEMDRQILGYDPHEARRARQRGTTVITAESEIAEAKSLVRNARRAIREGNRSLANDTYALAIEKLGRHEEAAELLAYARAEHARVCEEVSAAQERPRIIASASVTRANPRRANPSVDNVARQLRPPELDAAQSSRRAPFSRDHVLRVEP
ncbi:hypothetical protein [Allorhodopirellula heiligendammensis]|uniref:DUF4398 domain-containing protein n=1 Tax=Allorhodopirellula heiligendammensis TaxID=2714739 RepID=A0A5C6C4P2_9BACT|nr:hypothetical protein [Allorhodopirellula heiligendammensis]TWU19062.1 hypothetical protein Poly21_12330 [Allorhodopirellula heiligendammensis]